MGYGRGNLSQWLEQQGIAPAVQPGAITDLAQVRALLIAAAKVSEAVSYSELLGLLGYRFSRPKMRALCKTLDAIDARGTAVGEPALAVLVVRESDRMPGQGWWIGTPERGYHGAWTGSQAQQYVHALQQCVFTYWRDR